VTEGANFPMNGKKLHYFILLLSLFHHHCLKDPMRKEVGLSGIDSGVHAENIITIFSNPILSPHL
jgi:hypothetical protein